MTTPEISWADATLRVMAEVNRPIHCDEIAELIFARSLKATAGMTPHFTVAGEISRMRSGRTNPPGLAGKEIVKTGPGIYWLREVMEVPLPEPAPHTSDDEDEVEDVLDVTDATQNLSVAAYGLFWERDKVDWGVQSIWGYDVDPDRRIDFSNQQGVYLLHNWQSVVYVGKTAAQKKGLFQRLSEHHRKHTWSRKWERFSWFGIRRVDEVSGEMVDVTDDASPEVVTALMEAVLIEALGPSFNEQRGRYMGTLYRQFDPRQAFNPRLI